MFPQPTTELVRWQDFKVKSEVDTIFEIAQQRGWKDCEIFGRGDMITQPLESKGWKLVPADMYEYSIPAEGVDRVVQVMNAGVRIQGIIIADDERSAAPPARPAWMESALPSIESVATFAGKALMLVLVAGCAILFAPLLLLGAILGTEYDPKLVILVEDGQGETVWISLLTWYD